MSQYQESYEILSAALAFDQAFELAKQDGKIDMADIPLMIAPMVKLPAAISGADKAIGELRSMDPASRGEMLQRLANEYDIPNDSVEAKVEAGVEWLLATGKFVGLLLPASEPA